VQVVGAAAVELPFYAARRDKLRVPPEDRRMTAVPKPKMTEAEYLAIEEKAEFKSEFYRGEMFATSGASLPHSRIKDNLARHLNNQWDGGPCFAVTSDLKVKVNRTGLYTYPDVVVVCGEPEYLTGRTDVILNPSVVIEVLSPSTEKYDRGVKFRQYQRVPSLKEIVLVSRDEAVCERFVRQPDGTWNLTTIEGVDGELVFATVSARVRLADIYAGVTFPETPPR
jgi:Uma2 family endonuclease